MRASLRRTCVPFAVLALLVFAPRAMLVAQAPHPLLGTWRIVQYEVWDSAGVRSTPFGNPPTGYIVFDPSGIALVQLSERATSRSPMHAFGAYFGRYTIDARADSVRIRVEGGSFDDFIGTVQVRPFRISGDTLRLGDGKEYRATLTRVKPGH